MARLLCFVIIATLLLSGCEYGDTHGAAEASDRILGLKVAAREVFGARAGARDFSGYFVQEYPESAANYFRSPPERFRQRPLPLSYERDHQFIKWEGTPISDSHKRLVDRAQLVLRSLDLSKFQIEQFTQAAQTPGNFYAARYEDVGRGRLDNLTFYVLVPKSRILHHVTSTSTF